MQQSCVMHHMIWGLYTLACCLTECIVQRVSSLKLETCEMEKLDYMMSVYQLNHRREMAC